MGYYILTIAALLFFLLLILFCPTFRALYSWPVGKLVHLFGGSKHVFLRRASKDAQFFGNAIWMLATILGAAAFLFYSLSKTARFGISLSTLTHIRYGRRTIPLLLLWNLIVVLLMTFTYYIGDIEIYYGLIGYSIVTQTLQIFLLLSLIGDTKGRKIIETCYIDSNHSCFDAEANAYPMPDYWSVISMRRFLSGTETIEEKLEFAVDLLSKSFALWSNATTDEQRTEGFRTLHQDCTQIMEYVASHPDRSRVFSNSQILYDNIYTKYDIEKGRPTPDAAAAISWIAACGGVIQPILCAYSVPGRWELLGNLIWNYERDDTRRDYLILTVLASMFYLLEIGLLQDEETFLTGAKEHYSKILGQSARQTMDRIKILASDYQQTRFDANHIRKAINSWLKNVQFPGLDDAKRSTMELSIIRLLRGDSGGSEQNITSVALSIFLHSLN